MIGNMVFAKKARDLKRQGADFVIVTFRIMTKNSIEIGKSS